MERLAQALVHAQCPRASAGQRQAFKGVAWVDSTPLFDKAPPATLPAKAPAQKSAPQKAPPPLNAVQQAALAAMQRKLEIARYSPRTIRVYLNATKQLFMRFAEKHPKDIRTEDIETFQHELATERKASNSYLNQIVNAVRYYYKDVLGDAGRVTFIERPRKETKLPLVLSKAEVASILKAPDNLKHRAMLALAYSGGLRVSEVLALRPEDVLFDRGLVRIRGAKGNKDRTTLLGRSTAELLRNYMEHYRPTEHLFAGQNGGPYSARSLQKVLEQALHKTGIAKRATMHNFAAFIRHTPLGTRHRPAIHPSTPRPCQQQDHRDLHPCQYALPPRHHQPHGCAGRGLTSILAKASQCMPQ